MSIEKTKPAGLQLQPNAKSDGMQISRWSAGKVNVVHVALDRKQLEASAGKDGVVGDFPYGRIRLDKDTGKVLLEARRGENSWLEFDKNFLGWDSDVWRAGDTHELKPGENHFRLTRFSNDALHPFAYFTLDLDDGSRRVGQKTPRTRDGFLNAFDGGPF